MPPYIYILNVCITNKLHKIYCSKTIQVFNIYPKIDENKNKNTFDFQEKFFLKVIPHRNKKACRKQKKVQL